jgi:uncharacterized membrane protein
MKESHKRSAIKGISWRALGTMDTIVIAFFITGQLKWAISIGAIEVLTKIILFYLHERLWIVLIRKQQWNNPRWVSFTKGVSWRALGTMDTMVISYIITGNPLAALSIGSIEVFTKIILFYIHERLWTRVSWGKIPVVLNIEEKIKPNIINQEL